MKIIINADDLGMSNAVNEAIIRLFSLGLMDRCSLMINMSGVDTLVRTCKKDPFLFSRIGLHLNLTEGRPLTDEIRNTLFCDLEGNMTLENVNLYNRIYIDYFTRKAVIKEINAQMNMFNSMGFPLKHLDSHNYSSADISICKLVIDQASTYGFESIRLAKNIYSEENRGLKYFYRQLVNMRIIKFNSQFFSVESTDLFGSIFDVFKYIDVKKNNEKSIEVMVHPIIDSDGNLVDHYTNEQLVEPLKLLKSLSD